LSDRRAAKGSERSFGAFGRTSLPINLDDAMNKLNYSRPLKTVLGQRFVEAFMAVKEEEQVQYRKVISSWEREFLLLNV